MPVNRDDGCVEYLCDEIVSASVPDTLLFKPLLIAVSPGRNITENPPLLLLCITVASSDGDEHVSDFVSRNSGEPDICMVRGSTARVQRVRIKCSFVCFSCCQCINLLYALDTSIEPARSAVLTAVTRPGDVVING